MRKKILIIRFSSIGDIVLTTPVIRCIKMQMPDVELHYCTKKSFAGILKANPYIDKIIVMEKSLPACTKQIQREHYDHVIDLHNNLRTFIIISNLQLTATRFKKLNFSKWLRVRFKKNTLPDIHIVQRYLQAAETLGVKDDGKGLEYYIPEDEFVQQKDFPSTHIHDFDVVVIGGAHSTKKLPEDKIRMLCSNLKNAVILVGGPEDQKAGDEIARSNPQKIWNTCGMFTINQSASIIQQAKRVYTNDTGMMHIAAAFQKHIVAFWGNTIPEFGMYPYYGRHISLSDLRNANQIMEVNGLPCRPCSKIGFDVCPKSHFKCMRDISLENIS